MMSIIDTVKKEGSYNKFLKAMKKTGILKSLKKGEYTIFAPSDAAFSKISNPDYNSLNQKGNEEKLDQIIKYHIIPGKVLFEEFKRKQSMKTLQGSNLNFNDINPSETNIFCKNGMIHKIDDVIRFE